MNRTSGILLCCVATLLALGAVMVFSSLATRASTLERGMEYLVKHCLWIAIGLAGMFALWRLDYRRLERWAMPILMGAMLLLVLVLIPSIGKEMYGARRWIQVWKITFQPSEIAKIAVLIALAAMIARRQERMRDLVRGMAPCMAVVLAAVGLILLEPDFGTAALIGGAGTLLVLASGAPVFPLAAVAVTGAGGVAFLIWKDPTRLGRVLAFLDPWSYAGRAAYQLQHSLISLGSGGIFGRGLGASRQKLFFLPQSDTDFIFALIGEELGVVGTLSVLALFLVIVRQGMAISARARDSFGALLAMGLTMMIAMQAIIHVAVVTASMPTKGIVLPFMSSGGSAMVGSLLGVGVLMNIASQSREDAPAAIAAPASAARVDTAAGG